MLLALAAVGATPALASDGPGDLPEALRGRLVRLEEGRLAPAAVPENTRYIAFYFGASWCGPCRAFVPELRRSYLRLRAARHPVEIVFVSDDGGCRAVTDYIRVARMPWPAVACRERERLSWLQRARGGALPGILVYDRAGRLVLTSWSRSGASSPRRTLAQLAVRAGAGSP